MNDERWLELGERNGSDYTGCLLVVAAAELVEDAERSEVLSMLADA